MWGHWILSHFLFCCQQKNNDNVWFFLEGAQFLVLLVPLNCKNIQNWTYYPGKDETPRLCFFPREMKQTCSCIKCYCRSQMFASFAHQSTMTVDWNCFLFTSLTNCTCEQTTCLQSNASNLRPFSSQGDSGEAFLHLDVTDSSQRFLKGASLPLHLHQGAAATLEDEMICAAATCELSFRIDFFLRFYFHGSAGCVPQLNRKTWSPSVGWSTIWHPQTGSFYCCSKVLTEKNKLRFGQVWLLNTKTATETISSHIFAPVLG